MKCAIYSRVSTTEQENQNQIDALKSFIKLQNNKVVKIYTDEKSGRVSERPQFKQMMKDARLHKFDILYIWALDRFSREGIVKTVSYIQRLQNYNISIKSMQESWLDTSDDGMGELLIAIFSWVAKQEAQRISERTKAGLERRKKEGKPLGRPKGSKDKKPRDNLGYRNRWL
jgi:DNA invertase Pin-like site-specific DNA recombinase